MRHLGDLGEALLDAWCSQVGITPNRVNRDRTGWDTYLEFPVPTDEPPHGALDHTPSPLRAWIQVKSSDDLPQSMSVKLDNVVRLMQQPDPAFYLFLGFGGAGEPQDAYLVEVGGAIIERVQRRLREMSQVDQAPTPLHRRRFSMRPTTGRRLSSLDGLGLREAIADAVPEGMRRYQEQKRRLVDEVGYESPGRSEGTFTIGFPKDGRNPSEMLVDFDIGLIDELPLLSGGIWDSRFGIKAPNPIFAIKGNGARLTKRSDPTAEGTLVLRSRSSRKECRVPATLFAPTGVSHVVEPETLRHRWVLPFGQLVAGRGSAEVTFDLPDSREVVNLSELMEMVRVLRFLEAPGGDFAIQFRGMHFGTMGHHGLPLGQPFEALCDLIEYAADTANAAAVADELHLTIEQLWKQRDPLRLAACVLSGDVSEVGIHGDVVLDGDWFDRSLPVCYPVIVAVDLGSWRVHLVSVFHGEWDLGDRKHTPDSTHPVSVQARSVEIDQIFVSGPTDSEEFRRAEALRDITVRYSSSHHVLVYWE